MIEFTVIALLFFFLGRFTAGINDVKTIKEKIMPEKKTEVGVVKRPDAEKLRKRKTKEQEGEDAMEETLEKILK